MVTSARPSEGKTVNSCNLGWAFASINEQRAKRGEDLYQNPRNTTAGTIKLDGRDLTTVNLRSLHELTGLVAQDTQLFGESQVPSSGPSTNSLCFQTESVQLSCCAAQATTSKRTSLMESHKLQKMKF